MVYTLFKRPKSLQIVISCNFRKQVTSFQHTWQRIPFIYQKTEMETVRDNWIKHRLKHSRTNIKSCSSVSDAWGFRLKGLRWPYPCNFSYISLFVYFYSLYVANSPWKMSHSLGIWKSCGLKMQPRLLWNIIMRCAIFVYAVEHLLYWCKDVFYSSVLHLWSCETLPA